MAKKPSTDYTITLSIYHLYFHLPLMVKAGLITQEQANILADELKTELIKALGLD